MNFNESFDSLSTLIHELGHSLNSYYFTKYNPIYASTTIFTAEIPSIVNETLLGEYMYNDHKNNDPAFKATILQEIISNFFNTTSRQIVFSEFEYKVNDLVNNSLPFTKDTLKKIYLDLTDKYCGIKDKKKSMKTPYVYSLSRVLSIPHFYAGVFYVYKYAIGQIVAINIVKRLLNKEPGFLDKYFEFLKSGTSKSPLDTIKILNIDLSKQKTYDVAIEYIDEKINDFSRYASQIKYGKAST
jgi:oligoendopeptidase F